MSASDQSAGETLFLVASPDRLTVLPAGLTLPALAVSADGRESALLLQKWENESGLVDCFTQGEESFWWGCQRYWFSVSLSLLLDALRVLKPVFATAGVQPPRSVVISAHPAQAGVLAAAVAMLSPGSQITVKGNARFGLRDRLRWYGLIGVHRLRAALGRRRLRRAMRMAPARRVVIFQSEMQWEGGRDREMASVADALRARGLEVITVAAPADRLWKNLVGLFTRPTDHIFSDLVGRSSRPFVPTKTPDWSRRRFAHDGYDFSAFIRGWMESTAPADSLRESDAEWTRLIKQLAPAIVLMAHEHYHRAAITRATAAAGIRFGAVQHGLLSEYNPLYVLPKWARGKISLPWRIFVYGNRDVEILSQLSIYDPASIVVAGSTEWDLLRKKGVRTLGPGGEGRPRGQLRILFTSQHGLADGIIDGLLDGVQGLKEKARLRVRLHPWERAVWRWTRAFQRHPAVTVEFSRGGPLEKDISWCDLHVTFASTCLTHAAIAGIPSVLFGANAYPWREQFVQAGLALKVEDGRQFVEAVTHWRTDQARARFALDRERFLVDSGVGKILAGERIAEEVLASPRCHLPPSTLREGATST